jgi:cell division protein FtsB
MSHHQVEALYQHIDQLKAQVEALTAENRELEMQIHGLRGSEHAGAICPPSTSENKL